MIFSTTEKKPGFFLSQPHQPFFLLGIFWALALMLIFALSYKLQFQGVTLLKMMPTHFHAYGLIFIVLTQFFVGFLYTTFPRFCQSDVISKPYYLLTFALFQLGALVFSVGAFIDLHLLELGEVILLLAMLSFFFKLLTIYRHAQNPVKSDQFWILAALGFGVATQILAIVETFVDHYLHAYTIAFTLYATFLTFSVAQRMVPFFSHSHAEKKGYFLPAVFFALLAQTLAQSLDQAYLSAAISIVLGLFLIREFIRWDLHTAQAPAILKILHVALYWLAAGLILGGIISIVEQLTRSSYFFAQTHLIALGFVTTMLIGFGTRVTLGHSGQPPHADQTTLKIFYLTQLLVGVRFVFSMVVGVNGEFFWIFDLSIMVWMVLFGWWSYRFAPTLIWGAPKL